jgi:hypothetical protein
VKEPSEPLAVPVVVPLIKIEAPTRGPSADITFPLRTRVWAFSKNPINRAGISISSIRKIFPIYINLELTKGFKIFQKINLEISQEPEGYE